MMKKMWKNRSGVSPVIATILMVAITVVLAAVLYVMVMGFGNGESTPSSPVATLSWNGTAKITVNINPATSVDNMNFRVGSDTANMSASTPDFSATFNGLTVTFIDAGGDGKVSSGDYFTLTGTKTDSTATTTLFLLWISGDATQLLVSTAL